MKTFFSLLTLAAFTPLLLGTDKPKMVCKDSGKEVTKCCCDIKNGKFVCQMSKKTHDKCCCEGM